MDCQTIACPQFFCHHHQSSSHHQMHVFYSANLWNYRIYLRPQEEIFTRKYILENKLRWAFYKVGKLWCTECTCKGGTALYHCKSWNLIFGARQDTKLSSFYQNLWKLLAGICCKLHLACVHRQVQHKLRNRNIFG